MKKLPLIIFIFLIADTQILKAQVSFYKTVENGQFKCFGISNSFGPVMLSVTVDSLDISVSKLLASKGDTLLMFEIPKGNWNAGTDISKWVSASINFGDPEASPDETEYDLPFARGMKFKCIQSFNGKFSHNIEASRYAVDFKMPIGTAIHAARSGVVLYTKEDSNEGGNDREKFIDKANKIMILHDDGTIGNYVHLMQNGSEVEPGERVETGQLIGYSGNTGFTTTPHLHFVVRVYKDAVKIKFKSIKQAPKQGRTYRN